MEFNGSLSQLRVHEGFMLLLWWWFVIIWIIRISFCSQTFDYDLIFSKILEKNLPCLGFLNICCLLSHKINLPIFKLIWLYYFQDGVSREGSGLHTSHHTLLKLEAATSGPSSSVVTPLFLPSLNHNTCQLWLKSIKGGLVKLAVRVHWDPPACERTH